jgi:hypothetical protein
MRKKQVKQEQNKIRNSGWYVYGLTILLLPILLLRLLPILLLLHGISSFHLTNTLLSVSYHKRCLNVPFRQLTYKKTHLLGVDGGFEVNSSPLAIDSTSK